MRGRRTPTKIKELQGTREKSREVAGEVSFTAVTNIPPAPSYFKEFSRKVWREQCEELIAQGLLEKTDLHSLEAFCVAVRLAHDMGEKLETDGHDAKTFRTWRDAKDAVNQIAARFGFDPASRSKVGTGKKKDEGKHPFEGAVSGKMKLA
jgi:P27 family predicted phage terminase small subunit